MLEDTFMDNFVIKLLHIEQQLRILHWQTRSFSRHKGFGKTYNALGELIDTFMEAYMGVYGRPELTENNITLQNLDDMSVSEFVDESIEFLVSFNQKLDNEKDSDLLNIRDEMMTKMKALRYFLTLK
jgi:hypothetical protein